MKTEFEDVDVADEARLKGSIMSCSSEVLTGAGGSGRADELGSGVVKSYSRKVIYVFIYLINLSYSIYQ